ncbi:MAG: GIY-YIG nuclease family protein [Chloroflexi bacterium]|nr:GIY-YIG nuclease family protein [Chloroflexota bacterium]
MEIKNKMVEGFTSKYNVTKLVYFEEFATMPEAIAREKQIKGGSRQKKIDLIKKMNPTWEDLYEKFFV